MNNTLFGVVGLTLGFLTPNQLSHSLYIQEVRKNVGRNHTRLGEICIELNYLTVEQVEFIVERSRVLRMAPYMKPSAPKTQDGSEPPLQLEMDAPTFNRSVAAAEASKSAFDSFEQSGIRDLEEDLGKEIDYEARYHSLKARYDTAAEQVTQLSEQVHVLRERELELAIRAETSEHDLSELRQRMKVLEATVETSKAKGGFMKVFGRA